MLSGGLTMGLGLIVVLAIGVAPLIENRHGRVASIGVVLLPVLLLVVQGLSVIREGV